MNDYVKWLSSINYPALLSAVCMVVVGSVAAKEAVIKFCDSFGIEFSWVRAKREREDTEAKIEEDMKTLADKQVELENLRKQDIEKRDEFEKTIVANIDSLKDDISTLANQIEVREAKKRFRKLRFDILNFADRIVNSEQISAELIDQIFDEISEYEELSHEYEFKNNRVNSSVKVIQAKYEELLKQGKIYKGES